MSSAVTSCRVAGASLASAGRRAMAVKLLPGLVDYRCALDLQTRIVARKADMASATTGASATAGAWPDVLLLLQHPPTYTAGRRIRGADATEGARLRRLGAAYLEVDRGGLMTFHGPGQLVGYPIINLREANLSVRCLVNYIEETVIGACRHFGVRAQRTDDTGVWVVDNRAAGDTLTVHEVPSLSAPCAPKKIGAIGVRVSRRISSHGFALNCDTELKWFDNIVPCGLPGKGTTSLSAQLSATGAQGERHHVTCNDAVMPVRAAFSSAFGVDLVDASEIRPDLDRFIDDFLARYSPSAKWGEFKSEMSNGR